MDKKQHKLRHLLLHQHLDELIADWVGHTECLPSKTTIDELMKWSNEQTKNPEGDDDDT